MQDASHTDAVACGFRDEFAQAAPLLFFVDTTISRTRACRLVQPSQRRRITTAVSSDAFDAARTSLPGIARDESLRVSAHTREAHDRTREATCIHKRGPKVRQKGDDDVQGHSACFRRPHEATAVQATACVLGPAHASRRAAARGAAISRLAVMPNPWWAAPLCGSFFSAITWTVNGYT